MAITSLGVSAPISGITNLHVARVIKNTKDEFTCDKPIAYTGLAALATSTSTSDATYDADNGIYASETVAGVAQLTLTIANLTGELAEYMGLVKVVNLATQLKNVAGHEMVILYEVTNSDGSSDFVTAGTVRFTPVAKNATSRGANVNFQDVPLVGNITPPKNGSLGEFGEMTVSTATSKFKAQNVTVDEFRTEFFAKVGVNTTGSYTGDTLLDTTP